MASALTEPDSKRARNQAARRRRVVEAAMGLASEGGYDAVQMRDVAERAEVALGTLYRYFPSKDHLLVAALAEWAESLVVRLGQRPPRGTTAAERVGDVLRRAARALERDPNLTAALVTALSSPDPDVAGSKDAVGQHMHEMISTAMGNGGMADRDGIVRVLGQVWFAGLVGWVGGTVPPGRMADDLELAARLLLRDVS